MERHTTAEVEYALEWFSQSVGGPGGVLAAEVRALRVDARIYTRMELMLNEYMNGRALEVWTHEHDQLLATLKRVEALLPKWQEKASRPQSPLFSNAEHSLVTFTFEDCAKQLEAALSGEGEP